MIDERFSIPMINCHAGHIFINDFVDCYVEGILTTAKVKHFFKKVAYFCGKRIGIVFV